MNNKKKVK